MAQFKAVLVEWVDIVTRSAAWESPTNCKTAAITSIGWLCLESNTHIVISQGYEASDPDGDVLSPVSIPRGCITSIKTLKIK